MFSIQNAKTFATQIDKRLDLLYPTKVDTIRHKYMEKIKLIGECDALFNKCSELIKTGKTTAETDREQLLGILKNLDEACKSSKDTVTLTKLKILQQQGNNLLDAIEGAQMDYNDKSVYLSDIVKPLS